MFSFHRRPRDELLLVAGPYDGRDAHAAGLVSAEEEAILAMIVLGKCLRPQELFRA